MKFIHVIVCCLYHLTSRLEAIASPAQPTRNSKHKERMTQCSSYKWSTWCSICNAPVGTKLALCLWLVPAMAFIDEKNNSVVEEYSGSGGMWWLRICGQNFRSSIITGSERGTSFSCESSITASHSICWFDLRSHATLSCGKLSRS